MNRAPCIAPHEVPQRKDGKMLKYLEISGGSLIQKVSRAACQARNTRTTGHRMG